ncbi:MAG: J domain-containing protein [bacterium]
MKKNRRNYYRVLGVQPDAPFEVIRASYRALMSELRQHPDLGGDHWNATILNEVYHVLSHDKKRADYDKELFKRYSKNPNLAESLDKHPVVSSFCPFCKRPLSRTTNQIKGCPNCESPLKKPAAIQQKHCRRALARIKKTGKITFYTEWPQDGKEAQVVDLSPMGMRFNTEAHLSVSDVIKIKAPYLDAIAKVVEAKQGAIGAQFLTITFKDQKGTFVSTSI